MGQCIYNTWDSGCSMRDEGDTSTFKTDAVGWDEGGFCVVEDDPCPDDSCYYYEDIERNFCEDEDENTD